MSDKQARRVPRSCPPAFQGRYTVQPGNTFFNIAQIFRTRLEALAVNNRHIKDPNLINAGDILCVPGLIPYPCCIVLSSTLQFRLPFGTGAVAFVNFAPQGGQAVSFLATLPQPSSFGNFDNYVGEIYIPDIGGFGNQLFPSIQNPPTWATRIDLPTVASIVPNSRLVIRPANSKTGISGDVILYATIRSGSCHL